MNRRALLTKCGITATTLLAGCLTSTNGESEQMSAGHPEEIEDLLEWDVFDGSVSADTIEGRQAARLEITDEEARVRISNEFDKPIDLRGLTPRAAFRADSNAYPWIQIFDTDGDRIDFRTAVRGSLDFQMFDFGIDNIEGNPDVSSVAEIRITNHVGEGRNQTIWCENFGFSERSKPGTVLILFDDANVTDYTRALPLLEEHDLVAGTFINPGWIDNEDYEERLSLDQVHELQNAGWDVCSHSYDHPHMAELDRNEQETQIRSSKEWLIEHGFERGAEYFAYPHHSYTQTTLNLVDQYHELGFAGGYPALSNIQNNLLIHRIGGDPSADTARHKIDLTAEFGGVTPIFYHRLDDDFYPEFEETIEYLHEQESDGAIDVLSVREFDENGIV